MDLIKNWALSICVAGLAITVTQIVIPKGNVRRTLEIVLRVFLLSVLVSPILFSADFKGITLENFQDAVDEYSQSFELDMSSMLEEESFIML